MSALFKCAKDIRSLIESQLKSRPCKFNGSLKKCAGAGVLKQILYFLTWIIQGPRTPQTPKRTKYIELSANLIAQHILKWYKSDRQIHYQPNMQVQLALLFSAADIKRYLL